jgi:hypothetical protein
VVLVASSVRVARHLVDRDQRILQPPAPDDVVDGSQVASWTSVSSSLGVIS